MVYGIVNGIWYIVVNGIWYIVVNGIWYIVVNGIWYIVVIGIWYIVVMVCIYYSYYFVVTNHYTDPLVQCSVTCYIMRCFRVKII